MPIGALAEADFQPRPHGEAARHFAKKVPLTSEMFDRLTTEQRGRAFRIAKLDNARLVQRARDLLERAVRDGTSFRDFRRSLLEAFGGEGVPAPALSRLRLAFRQNSMAAYNDARRETLDDPEIAGAFPFRRYMTVGNGRAGVNNVRATHAALHGKVFRGDDPFWDIFTPPWEYGCRCTFIALTAGQVRRGRIMVWTYAGGGVRPLTAKAKGRGFPLAPNPRFSRALEDLDLGSLDDDLRKIVEEYLAK